MKVIFVGGRPFTNLTHMKKYEAIKKVGDLNHKSRKDMQNPYDRKMSLFYGKRDPEYTYIGSLGREMYCIINDGGYEMMYPKNCFMTEQEFRNKKLNQILE